jgi:tripartite-type tricarboxylate transporter receptor subunit TctC
MMRIATIVSSLLLLACIASGSAQDTERAAYPTKPVRILVPFPAGGAVDIVARTLGDELSKRWGQSVVIENRPGAGGTIATQAAATSAPDGYTLILVATGHALNPHFFAKLPYDSVNDFTPITLVGSAPKAQRLAVPQRARRARRRAPAARLSVVRPCRQWHLAASGG